MKRVTGIGGIFFKSGNADKLCEWYREHLGIAFTNPKSAIGLGGEGFEPPTLSV